MTPYSLAFGAEAVLPIELTIPSHRAENFNLARNSEALAAEVDLLEERREEAAQRAAVFRQNMVNQHRKLVKPKEFQVGDLVLRNIPATGTRVKKLEEKWEGPFIVTGQASPAAYRLADAEGNELRRPWNAVHLKKYYP